MKRILSIILIISLVLIQITTFHSSKAYACSCAYGDTKEKLKNSSTVFEGKVVNIGDAKSFSPYSQVREYTFAVERAWKGVKDKHITIFSFDDGSSMCGYQFSQDQTYIVYAMKDKNKDNMLLTSLCSNNLLISEAEEDLKLLGTGTVISSDDNGESSIKSLAKSPVFIYILLSLFLLIIIVAIWMIRIRTRK